MKSSPLLSWWFNLLHIGQETSNADIIFVARSHVKRPLRKPRIWEGSYKLALREIGVRKGWRVVALAISLRVLLQQCSLCRRNSCSVVFLLCVLISSHQQHGLICSPASVIQIKLFSVWRPWHRLPWNILGEKKLSDSVLRHPFSFPNAVSICYSQFFFSITIAFYEFVLV